MKALSTLLVLALGLLTIGATAAANRAPREGRGAGREEPDALAVIVNPKNPTTNLSFTQLRSYLKLEQQFWPSKERVELFLRPTRSTEMELLLSEVYRMSSDELRKYWVGKIFRGEIDARPAVIPTARAAGARVSKIEGALTVVLASEVPAGVRVLSVDGKRPGDADYPLVVPASATLDP